MAEGEPPPLGSWTSLAFIQGPLVEEIGLYLGRVVPIGRGVEAIGKVLPLPWLQALFKKTQEATKDQMKEDGKHVIKVVEAIQIVESWLNGLTGTVQELADLLQDFTPPIRDKRTSLLDRIAQDLRNHALKQTKKKYKLLRPPLLIGPNKNRFAVDWTRRKVGDHHESHFDEDPNYPGPVKLL
jgi:hypothetical protein